MKGVTRMLNALGPGDPHAASRLLPLVYGDLRKLAAQRQAQEQPGQTLRRTALVHGAYPEFVEPPLGSSPRLHGFIGIHGGQVGSFSMRVRKARLQMYSKK